MEVGFHDLADGNDFAVGSAGTSGQANAARPFGSNGKSDVAVLNPATDGAYSALDVI